MATITGAQIIQRVRKELNDPTGVRWKDAELVTWLNDSQREIVIVRPDSSVAVRSIALTANTTLQQLPADGLRLIDIIRNMGPTGDVPGAPIRLIEREQLDLLRASWHSDPATASVKNYCYDGRVPKHFYVYPRPATAFMIEAHFGVVPAIVTMVGVDNAVANSVISLDDVYATAMVDYVMMRCRAKDGDARDDQKSAQDYARFLQRLGLKVQVDRSFDPNRNSPPKEVRRAAGGENDPAF